MTRWLLALLFAFGTVSFLTACEEKSAVEEAADDAADAVDDATDAAGDAAGDAADALDNAGE